MDFGSAVIVGDLATLPLAAPGPSAAAVYDRPIGLRLLHQDPESGGEHYLVRYPAGLRGRLHEHSAAHTIVVVEGKLEANGQVIGPPAYAHFPAGQPMRHQTAGDEPCLFVIIFHGPFDVRTIDDPRTT
jgi:quercetin dioxygenase-like cupin family protein